MQKNDDVAAGDELRSTGVILTVEQIEKLDAMARREDRSRTYIIRRAVAEFIEREEKKAAVRRPAPEK